MIMFIVPGVQEWGFILLLGILIFGASKLPDMARSAGSSIGEFRKARIKSRRELEDIPEIEEVSN